jgi:hypothetical protein
MIDISSSQSLGITVPDWPRQKSQTISKERKYGREGREGRREKWLY